MKNRWFWEEVIDYFEKEIGETRGYDAITSKWKNRVRPRIGAFCAIIDNIKRWNESGSSDVIVYQKALAEYEAQYEHPFTLEPSQGGFNLNDEADGSEEKIKEERPICRDRANKKASSSAHYESSSIIRGGLVELVADKWKNIKSANWGKKKEQ
ncbi:hypothetical protein Tco_1195854 [Tanacetum coccineum]